MTDIMINVNMFIGEEGDPHSAMISLGSGYPGEVLENIKKLNEYKFSPQNIDHILVMPQRPGGFMLGTKNMTELEDLIYKVVYEELKIRKCLPSIEKAKKDLEEAKKRVDSFDDTSDDYIYGSFDDETTECYYALKHLTEMEFIYEMVKRFKKNNV